MSDDLVVEYPNPVGVGLIDHINDLNDRVAVIEGAAENVGGPFLPLTGGTIDGSIKFVGPAVPSPLDFSKGIELYDGMGLSVTSSALNIAVNDSQRKIRLISGSQGAVIAEFSHPEGLVVLEDLPIAAKTVMVDGQNSDERYLSTAGGNMMGGINWHYTAGYASNPDDLTQLWRWYDGTEDFGMSVTTGRLNYVTTHPDNWHYFRIDAKDIARVTKYGIDVLGDLAVRTPRLEIAGQDSDERYMLKSEQTGPPAAATIGDVKSGFQTTDHAGWFILNGRAITALTTEQKAAATSLGFATNLPDALNAVALQTSGTMGAVMGSMTRTLTQANLPSLTATTSSDGDHYHAMMAVTNDAGVCGFSEMLANGAYPASKVWSRQANTATGNNQNIPIVGKAMENSGPHSHTVSIPGSSTPIDITPKSMCVNMFVYLGAA